MSKSSSTNKIKGLLKLEKSIPRPSVLGATEWRLPGGKLHREYGPAVEYPDGDGNEYWINGTNLTEEEFKKRRSDDEPVI